MNVVNCVDWLMIVVVHIYLQSLRQPGPWLTLRPGRRNRLKLSLRPGPCLFSYIYSTLRTRTCRNSPSGPLETLPETHPTSGTMFSTKESFSPFSSKLSKTSVKILSKCFDSINAPFWAYVTSNKASKQNSIFITSWIECEFVWHERLGQIGVLLENWMILSWYSA